MKEELLADFIAQMNAEPNNTNNQYVIGMVGLNGSGKSTLAHAIAKDSGLYVASNDSIRRFLNAKGYGGAHPRQDLLEYIAENGGEYLYKNKISHIIDADILKFYGPASDRAKKHNFKFYLIKVNCPENIIIDRLKKRHDKETRSKDDLSMADVGEYEKRKKIHQDTPQPEYDFVFNTSEPLEPQIHSMKSKLKL